MAEQIKIILPEAVKRLSTFCKVPDMKHGRLAAASATVYCTANRMTGILRLLRDRSR